MKFLTIHSANGDRCGIRQYGEQLDRSLRALVEVQPFTHMNLPGKGGMMTAEVMSPGDVVLVHYEPSLLKSPDVLFRFARSVKEIGGRVVFVCHWFSSEIEKTFGDKVDRYVVHRVYPDLPPSAVHIPLGAPLYELPDRRSLREKFGFEGRFVLMTLGFLSDWKRTPDVVEAIAKLASGAMLVRAQTPKPFSAEGKSSYQIDLALQRVTEKYPGKVVASTDFIGEKDLLDMVHAADLGFVYHGIDTGSVSAATKQFVSARTPVVVTGSSHASDLVRGCRKVGSFSVEEFAKEVVRTASDEAGLAKLREGIAKEYQRINMDVVAKKYVSMMGG